MCTRFDSTASVLSLGVSEWARRAVLQLGKDGIDLQ